MTEIQVALGPRSYPIVVGRGVLAQVAQRTVEIVQPTAAAILTHIHLARLYAEPVVQGFARLGVRTTVLTVPSGERIKNLRSAARLYDSLLAAGMDRRSVLITLGGGVLGDLGGFVAATFLRGIPFVQAPTTLLAQVDASIGGKTGVDLRHGKNLVGAFYQPRAVFIDTETLRSLPIREMRSGLAEVFKYGIIRDKGFFERLVAELPRLLRRDLDALSPAIIESCKIKADVVGEDETEQGSRAILNFGHTVGHALETVTGYRRYKHGEAIAIGMVAASLVGEELRRTSPEVTANVSAALRRAGLPTHFPTDVDLMRILNALPLDKKTVAGRLTFVLAPRIGSVELLHDIPLAAVEAALLRQGGVR